MFFLWILEKLLTNSYLETQGHLDLVKAKHGSGVQLSYKYLEWHSLLFYAQIVIMNLFYNFKLNVF